MLSDQRFKILFRDGAEKGSFPYVIGNVLKTEFDEIGIKTIWRASESKMLFPDLPWKFKLVITNQGAIQLHHTHGQRRVPMNSKMIQYPRDPANPEYNPIPAVVKAIQFLHQAVDAFMEVEDDA